MANQSAIGYIRVSSKMQGKSGLGLEAQQRDIQRFCETNEIVLGFSQKQFPDYLS